MRKFWKWATAASAALVVGSMGAGAAGAITAPPAGYGFDGHPDVVVTGGSDTTAKMMLALADLWNQSAINNGCHHSQNSTATTVPTIPNDPNSNSVFQNACDQTDEPFNLGNYDGDTLANANPTGSGAGRAALEGTNGGHYEGTVNVFSNPGRADAVTFHANSAIVQDDTITNADVGKLFSISSDSHVPQPAYIGTILPNTPSAGHTSFTISASATAQKDDPYTNTVDSSTSINVSKYGCLPVGPTGGPVPDIGRSSSVAGGNGNCTNSEGGAAELGGTTFWGYAHDSVEVYGFNVDGVSTSNGNKLNATANLTANVLDNIWSDHAGTNNGPLCPGSSTKHYMTWGQLDATLWPPADPYFAAPIVPWKMNTGSGTYGTFRDFIRNNTSPADAAFDPSSNSLDPCARTLDIGTTGVGNDGTTNGTAFALENDIKPLINTPGLQGSALDTTPASANNPQNWIHWASFGVFSAFSYTSSVTTGGHTYSAVTAAIGGSLPSTSLVSTYPIQRILWNVTRKGDADCPAVLSAGKRVCDFAGQPGPVIGAGPGTDLNVTGGTSGVSGAIREFIRFTCRSGPAQQGLDPFTGKNYDQMITSAIVGAGFTQVPAASRTSGSRCDVNTQVVK